MCGQAGDSKTELWTWAQYLEECKAVAAPNKLFQEVSVTFTPRPWFGGRASATHDLFIITAALPVDEGGNKDCKFIPEEVMCAAKGRP